MNFYAFHIGDYSSATQHLTELEDLAYRRMMDVYYVSERALPLERRQIYRLVRANSEAMREAVDIVLTEFFSCEEDGWHHKRCDAEIAKARVKSEKAKANGKLGGEAKAKRPLDENVANATASTSEPLAPNPNPIPNPNKERGGVARPRGELFAEAEPVLYQLPEISEHPVRHDLVLAPILNLMEEGIDLHRIIVPSIRRQAGNASSPIDGWKYFVKGIRRDAQAPTVSTGAAFHGSRNRRPSAAQEMRDAIADVQAHAALSDQGPRD